MKSLALVAGLSFWGMSAAAGAAITVIGNSSARLCYEAARAHQTSSAAMAQCDAALDNEALTPGDEVATHVNRGIVRAMRDDLDGAVKDYDAALALDADEAEAWLNKAMVYLRSDKAAEALPMFDAAVAKRTREPAMAHYGRAVAYEQTGNLRAAYADYRRASDLIPGWEAPKAELTRFQVRAAASKDQR